MATEERRSLSDADISISSVSTSARPSTHRGPTAMADTDRGDTDGTDKGDADGTDTGDRGDTTDATDRGDQTDRGDRGDTDGTDRP
jgi:hypothetical protein